MVARAPGVPGIYLSGEGAGCSEHRGDFYVAELVRDANGKLLRFAATYDHRCLDSASSGYDHGEIRFQSSLGWAGWTISTDPYSAFNFETTEVGQTGGDAREVVVKNPSTDWVSVNPRFVGDHPSDFVFTDPTHCFGELEPGEECRFSVAFAPTKAGSRSAQLIVGTDVRSTYKAVELSGTALPGPPGVQVAISANPDPAYVGDPVTITAAIDPPPGVGIVDLFEIGPVGVEPKLLATAAVLSDGTAVFERAFDQNEALQIQALFTGNLTYPAARSPILERKQKHPPETWFNSKPHPVEADSTGFFDFAYIANDPFYTPAVRFECKLDNAAWRTCSSPQTTPVLAQGQHTFTVRGIDSNGRVEPDPEAVTWIVDLTDPEVAAPSAGLSPVRIGTSVPVSLLWPDPVDRHSDIADRDLQRKVGTGAWRAVPAAGDTALATPESLAPGTVYRYRQRAADSGANVSDWSAVLALKSAIRQQGAASVKRSQYWSTKSITGSSGGSVVRSSRAGAWVRTTFTGLAVGWVSTMGPTMGAAKIYLDGSLVATVDLYRSTVQTRTVAWSRSFAAAGTHTLEIRVVGAAGRPNVDLDAFALLVNP
jgi:hypothetical protein